MTTTADPPPPPETSRRKKRRWGDQAPAPEADSGANVANGAPASSNDPAARKAALQASIQARLAALKARTAPAAPAATPRAAAVTSTAPPSSISNDKKRPAESAAAEPKKRARVFELDLNDTASARLLEKQRREEELKSRPKEKINPYLAHVVDTTQNQKSKSKAAINKDSKSKEADKPEDELLDTRLAGGQIAKPRLASRPITFVTPGTYVALAEKKRRRAALAEESGYLSGRKDGRVIESVGMGGAVAGIYGATEAGKADHLPGRIDAPELEVEDYLMGGRNYRHTEELNEMTDRQKEEAAVVASIAAGENSMPYAVEWWDAELLPGKLRKELAATEGKALASRAKKRATTDEKKDDNDDSREKRVDFIERCYKHASLSNSKTHSLLQHPIPVLTPAQKAAAEALKNKPPTLHLTKAERKRHRKLRRAERLREQQDMQAAGLVPPPEPRLTLSNYMKVLGDQAVLDPSKMEAKVMEQVHQRKLKHEKMNEERKLTKEQKAAKHARKLAEDTSTSVAVALFWVRDMSHPYHRAKVDLNAQQNSITGGVLECDRPGKGEDDKLVLVVAEGGEKAIKRYTRLMTVRMKWKGEDFYEEDDEEEEEELMVGEDEDENGETKPKRKKFNPNNECELIWTGMAVKRAFHSFMFQSAQNTSVARKILEAKGVAHYWDLLEGLVQRKEGGGEEGIRFRLVDGGNSDEMMDD